MQTHIDPRRTIYDWASGNFKSAKAVVVHQETAIGSHYHNNKTEEFLLLTGMFKEITVGASTLYNIAAPYKVVVPPGTFHRFVCTEGSILMGTATELFDANDEIRL